MKGNFFPEILDSNSIARNIYLMQASIPSLCIVNKNGNEGFDRNILEFELLQTIEIIANFFGFITLGLYFIFKRVDNILRTEI